MACTISGKHQAGSCAKRCVVDGSRASRSTGIRQARARSRTLATLAQPTTFSRNEPVVAWLECDLDPCLERHPLALFRRHHQGRQHHHHNRRRTLTAHSALWVRRTCNDPLLRPACKITRVVCMQRVLHIPRRSRLALGS